MSEVLRKNDLMKIIVTLIVLFAAVATAVFAGFASLAILLPAAALYLLIRAVRFARSADKLYAGEKMCPGCNSRNIDILPKSSMKLGYWEENGTYKHPAKCDNCGFEFYITTAEDIAKARKDAKTGLGLSAVFLSLMVITAILILI